MNDQAKYTVTLEFETSGADAEINNLRKFQETVDEVSRQGGLSEKSQNRLSRALHGTGQAASNASGDLRRSEDSLISLRYANYDLASTLLGTAAAITAVGAASLVSFAQQESAFTEVERIAGGTAEEIQNLRDSLQEMSTAIPVAFGELSNIASLGAALDIPAEQLDEFTESVAKFAATTGVTVEAAATGFGKLAAYLKIPEEQFDALGSAILKAGNISVATEEQVLKFAQALALPGARIGFTTEQVVALGATLASFGNINVEGAGSALNRVTKNIEKSLAENGEALQRWASIAGLSAEQFRLAWGADSGGTFNRVIQGLSQDVEGLSGNLSELGLNNIRDQRIIEALALNYQKYNDILVDTSSAWREGIYINEAYGLVLDDLSSKWSILVNALSNVAAAVGSELAPAFSTALDVMTNTLVAVTDFVNSPLGGRITALVAGLAAFATGWLAVRGAIALASASGQALLFITRALGSTGIAGGIAGLSRVIFGLGSASQASAGAVLTLRSALVSTMRAIPGLAIFYTASSWIFDTGSAAQETGNALIFLADVAAQVLSSVAQSLAEVAPLLASFLTVAGMGLSDNSFSNAVRSLGIGLRDWGTRLNAAQHDVSGLGGSMAGLSANFDDLDSQLPGMGEGLDGLGDGFDGLGDSAEDAARRARQAAIDTMREAHRAAEEAMAASNEAAEKTMQAAEDAADKVIEDLRKVADAAQEALNEFRTYADYAGDLQKVFNRTFEITFGFGQAKDEVTTMFRGLVAGVDQSNKRVDNLRQNILRLRDALAGERADLVGIDAQIAQKSYFKQIAQSYGDTARVVQLEADLAKLRADRTKKERDIASTTEDIQSATKDLAKEIESQSRALTGNTDAAIENRKSLDALYQKHLQYITALAASGASEKELEAAVKRSKEEFGKQAKALGFSVDEVNKRYVPAWKAATETLKLVPRNITTTFKYGDAMGAVKEYRKRAKLEMDKVKANARVTAAVNTKAAIKALNDLNRTKLKDALNELKKLNQAKLDNAVKEQQRLDAAIKTSHRALNSLKSEMGKGFSVSKPYIPTARYDAGIPMGYDTALYVRGLREGFLQGYTKGGYFYKYLGTWSEGGFTGKGGKYETAGIVHKGEYVIPKKDVNQATGLPYADALGRLMGGVRPVTTVVNSGGSQPGATVVDLSARSVQALAHATSKKIVVDGKVLARSTERSNRRDNTVGAY